MMSPNSGESKMFKLPPYAELKANGIYRYRRRVPIALVEAIGKERLYRKLGKTKADVLNNYSKVHSEVEALFQQAETNTLKEKEVFAQKDERERVLHLVEKHYGKEASQLLALGQVDDNLELALEGLADDLHGKIPAKTEAILHSGKVPDIDKTITISKILDMYLEVITDGDVANDRKKSNQINRIKIDLEEALGSLKINKLSFEMLTRQDALDWRASLLSRVSPNSVLRYKNTIIASLNWYIREQALDNANVFANLDVRGSGHSKDAKHPFTREELSKLDDTFASTPLDLMYHILRDTGMRLKELCGVCVGDISLQNNTLSITPNAIRSLKTKNSIRTIPLSEKLIEALQLLRQGKDDNEPVFPKYAIPSGNNKLSDDMNRLRRKAVNVEKKTIHSLRHTMKDSLRNSGCDSQLIDAILGHSSGTVGSNYGSGYNTDIMRDALEKVWK
ncbi:tyrosine-type recombinase/integrase [Amylibacter sp.]|nr:tyrosine-type recombinase/integrase [Amylibacter sp.]